MNNHGMNDAEKLHCENCKWEYTLHDPANQNSTRDGRVFRFPNEVTPAELRAHEISHLESPKVRRAVGSLAKLPDDLRKEVLDFFD